MIDGNIEEALDLRGVQVHREDPIGSGRRDQIRHQLGGDRNPRPVLLVLARITVVGDHSRDSGSRGAFQSIEQNQQLHEVLVHWRAGWLNDEDVRAADVLVDLTEDLAVGEIERLHPPEVQIQVLTDLPDQFGMCSTAKNLQITVHHSFPHQTADPEWLGR